MMNEKGKKIFLLAAVFLLAVAIGYWFGIKSDSDGSRAAEPTILPGITQNGPGANDASAQTADTILH